MISYNTIKEKDGIVIIDGVEHFHPDHVFDCGQCFRWERNDDGSYTGLAGSRTATIGYDGEHGELSLYGTTADEVKGFWWHYLDLDRDYGMIKRELAAGDPVMEEAIAAGSGIRILNQEKWETLLSFIISQNNNIPRIKGCIASLARTLGEYRGTFGGREWHALPAPETLAEATEEDLAPCRLGYRARYLLSVGRQVAAEGPYSLECLADPGLTSDETISRLQAYDGVGPKVASCIALFAMGKIDSFPIDVWVRRVMHQLYGLDEKKTAEMKAFAGENFAPWGGIAQQYLFYYITHINKI